MILSLDILFERRHFVIWLQVMKKGFVCNDMLSPRFLHSEKVLEIPFLVISHRRLIVEKLKDFIGVSFLYHKATVFINDNFCLKNFTA